MTNNKDLVSAKSVKEIEAELSGGEWMKKPALARAGSFNVIGANLRTNLTFNDKPSPNQWVFEIQLLDGDFRGTSVLCSFDVNVFRDKIAAAVKKYGAIGPFTLQKKKNAYIFVSPQMDVDDDDDEEIPF